MFVSGSLKDKSIDFYREKVFSFDDKGIDTPEAYISYKGELLFAPWDKDKERKLASHEEKHINAIEEKIFDIFSFYDKNGSSYSYFTGESKRLISKIRGFNRNIACTLMENLYSNLSKSNDRILTMNEFFYLLKYLEDKYENLDQVDIDIIMYLFKNGYKYGENSVHSYKVKTFHVDEKMIDNEESYKLYKLGEFLSQYRLSRVGSALNSEYSSYILPIYFLIKDEKTAERFLQLCRRPELDRDLAIKNAESLNVPENIISLVK